MKLLSISLLNFQGIKAAKYVFDGKSASFFGDNATGKTTVFNAMTWLLFDKSSTGAKGFTPKTKGPDGDLHFLDHAAEGVFQTTGGQIVTLKKCFHENYQKRRGSNTEEFTGHSTDFFVDGVPVKEKEYQETVETLCGDSDKVKVLTMPDYFPEEMLWSDRRRILLDVCGDVSDDQVIKNDTELGELNSYLLIPGTRDQHYTVDEFRKIAGAKKSDINKQLESIPTRVDEANLAVPDLKGLNLKTIEQKIKELFGKKESLEKEKAQVLNGDSVAAGIRKQIAEANAELADARAGYAKESGKANEGIYESINAVKSKQMDIRNKGRDLSDEIARLDRETARIKVTREDLFKEYNEVQALTWNQNEAVCPTCKRTLPEDQVQETRNIFNEKKSERLERINTRGKQEASKEMIDANNAKAKDLQAQEKQANAELADFNLQLVALQKKIKDPAPFESTEAYQELATKIDGYKKNENNQEKKLESLTSELRDKISAINSELQEQEELKKTEKELSKAYEFIERGLYLCELFVKTKVGLLNSKINGKFKNVRFRLFVEQVNGGIAESCDVLIPTEGGTLVPFQFSNNGARINAGLEIIDTLSKHWGMTIPVFIDNAESVTALYGMGSQMIRLVVSGQDKELRLVVENGPGKEEAKIPDREERNRGSKTTRRKEHVRK